MVKRWVWDLRERGHVGFIQTDGGSEFKETFTQRVHAYCDRHRVARPYKKNEQAYIGSFNRTVRKECLGWGGGTQWRTYLLARQLWTPS